MPHVLRGTTRWQPFGRLGALVVALAVMVAGLVQVLPHAGADQRSWHVVSSNEDAAAVDTDGNGHVNYAPYGVINAGLAVGEQPRDGSDLRLFLPFAVPGDAVRAVKDGGNANVMMRVSRADNLAGQRVVVEGYTVGTVASKSAYAREITPVATIFPMVGRFGVDVTDLVRSMAGQGRLTLRLRLDSRPPRDGKETSVNIATSESRYVENRPLLTLTSKELETETAPTTVPTAAPTTTSTSTTTSTTTTTTAPPVVTPVVRPTPTVGVGDLQFDDEFDGASLDSTKWAAFDHSNYGAGGSDDACHYARNVDVADGALQITAKRETTTCNAANPDGSGKTYYWSSGFVTTRGQADGVERYSFTHGYAEARMKSPRFNAAWPAFWMVGDKNAPGWPAYGEIDVAELNGIKPDKVGADIHYSVNGTHQHINPNVMNAASGVVSTSQLGAIVPPLRDGFTNDWHTYGVLWTPDLIRFYVDSVPWTELRRSDFCTYSPTTGKQYKCFPKATTDFWDLPHTFHLGMAVGGIGPRNNGYTGIGTATGYSDGNLLMDGPATWKIDYVRQWGLP